MAFGTQLPGPLEEGLHRGSSGEGPRDFQTLSQKSVMSK